MAAASLLRFTSAAAKKWNPTFTSQLLPHSPRFAPNFLSESSKLNRNFPPTATASLLRFTSAAASNWNQTSTSQSPRLALNFLSESSNLSRNLIPNSTISITNPRLSIRDDKTSSIEVIAESIQKALRKPALASSGGRTSNSSLFRSNSSHYQYNSNRNNPKSNKEDFVLLLIKSIGIGYIIGAVIGTLAFLVVLLLPDKASVLKLQVGVRATTNSIQKDLNRIADDVDIFNRIADNADTSRRAGFHYVLKETTQALLRDRDHCISGYSSADEKSGSEVEKCLQQLSVDERGKFDKETHVNVNNIKRKTKGTTTQDGIAFSNEYVVITILVAVEGEHKLPTINGSGDVKEALQKLASIPANKLKAVEVLRAPRMGDDTLSEQELRKDYPLLKRL